MTTTLLPHASCLHCDCELPTVNCELHNGGPLSCSHHVLVNLGGRWHPPVFPPAPTNYSVSVPSSRQPNGHKSDETARPSRVPAVNLGGIFANQPTAFSPQQSSFFTQHSVLSTISAH